MDIVMSLVFLLVVIVVADVPAVALGVFLVLLKLVVISG